MPIDTRVISNKRVGVFLGPASGIANFDAPTLAEMTALLNVSGAINWDSFDFNLQASDSSDDRTLVDAAGAKSRSFDQFGGTIEFVYPKPGDTSSIYRQAYNILKGDRTKLAIVIRPLTLNSVAPAAGDVVNAYRVLEDAHSLVRADQSRPSYAYKVNFTPQDDVSVNAIIPSATPTKVTITPASTGTATVGTNEFLRAVYEGNNVTIGAQWAVSDATKATITPHGILIPLVAGTVSVSATYPGSAASTPTVYTIS